uniref:Uncharacterized protein n=1 Tax=Arundo donax TaxID=35708 RepID=A0A0A9APR7_ARUDO
MQTRAAICPRTQISKSYMVMLIHVLAVLELANGTQAKEHKFDRIMAI